MSAMSTFPYLIRISFLGYCGKTDADLIWQNASHVTYLFNHVKYWAVNNYPRFIILNAAFYGELKICAIKVGKSSIYTVSLALGQLGWLVTCSLPVLPVKLGRIIHSARRFLITSWRQITVASIWFGLPRFIYACCIIYVRIFFTFVI